MTVDRKFIIVVWSCLENNTYCQSKWLLRLYVRLDSHKIHTLWPRRHHMNFSDSRDRYIKLVRSSVEVLALLTLEESTLVGSKNNSRIIGFHSYPRNRRVLFHLILFCFVCCSLSVDSSALAPLLFIFCLHLSHRPEIYCTRVQDILITYML